MLVRRGEGHQAIQTETEVSKKVNRSLSLKLDWATFNVVVVIIINKNSTLQNNICQKRTSLIVLEEIPNLNFQLHYISFSNLSSSWYVMPWKIFVAYIVSQLCNHSAIVLFIGYLLLSDYFIYFIIHLEFQNERWDINDLNHNSEKQ